jgi:hypothetical protein
MYVLPGNRRFSIALEMSILEELAGRLKTISFYVRFDGIPANVCYRSFLDLEVRYPRG